MTDDLETLKRGLNELATIVQERDAEIIRLRAELEAVRPKKFVSPPGTFELAELSDTIESGGRVYINYDDFMDVLHRHAATERALIAMTRERDEAFNAGIEAALAAHGGQSA